MSRFFAKPEDIKGNLASISGDEAHHILDVMRLKKGDSITAFDGEGREYEGIIRDTEKKKVTIEIKNTRKVVEDGKVKITLAQSISKGDKTDFIIEKAVELGASEIIPLITERTIVRFDSRKEAAKNKRWSNIALSASKQCGRLKIPQVHPVTDFNSALNSVKNYNLALMACLCKDTMGIKEVLRDFKEGSVIVFIGPEGDFTEEEINRARNAGCRLISLGPRVLRVETAALNILSILQYELG